MPVVHNSHTNSTAGPRRVRPALLAASAATALLILFGLGLWLAHPAPVAAQQPPPSPTFDLNAVPAPETLPAGRSGHSTYQESCAPCHGEQGNGDGPTAPGLAPNTPTAFADPNAVWTQSPAEMFHTTKFGRMDKMMPPWQQRLDDRQIWNVIAYLWSLHTDATYITAGKDLYILTCASCHGAGGAGDGPEAQGTLPNFADPAAAMARSQEDWLAGWLAAHPEIGSEWSLDDQSKVLEYIRTFSYVPSWESPYRPGDGAVRGRVVQGTPGGPALPADTLVTLEAYADFQPVATFSATLGISSTFSFGDLAVDPGIVYLASVQSGGIRYSSPVINLSAEQPSADTQITVYEATDDPSGIRLEQVHWIIDSQPGALLVGQIMSFGSTSDRTYTGKTVEGVEGPATVAFQVPAAAQQITFENGALGDRFQRAGDLVYDTTPVVPGEATQQIIVRYLVPYADTAAAVSQEFLYPVGRFSLLVADVPGIQIEVPELTSEGTQDFQGQVYHIWQQENVPPGTVHVNLAGLLAPGAAGGAAATAAGVTVALLPPWMVWSSALLVAAALGGGLAWSWRKGRIRSADPVADLRRQHNDLVKRIARLDDRHTLGEVETTAWQMQRAQLKAQLFTVAQRLADAGQRPT